MVAPGNVVIIGTGPAGMEAAMMLVKSGFRPIVIDAGARSGGQIYRRPPKGRARSYRSIYGADAAKARHLHRSFDALRDRMDYRPNTRVWGAHGGKLFLDGPAGRTELEYDKLILCTGATDRVFPVSGWEMPGVYTLGGAQIALKSQTLALGNPIGFVGAGPLLWLVGWQHMQAGATVAGIWCTSRHRDMLAAVPLLVLRPMLALRGVRQIAALRQAGVSIHFGVHPAEVTADGEGQVAGLRWRQGAQTSHTPLRAVALGWHLRSETQIAQLLGAHSKPGSQAPLNDGDGRSLNEGLYFAGDGVEILGGDAARIAGRRAARAVMADAGQPISWRERLSALSDRIAQARMRGFARGLARAFPTVSDAYLRTLPQETVVCRCENVRLAEMQSVIVDDKATDLNRIKALTRAGMGRCQGRYCGAALAAIVTAKTGQPRAAIVEHRAQAPIYPLTIVSKDGRVE